MVLPATALADQGDSLSRRDLQGHAIDRAYNTTPAEVALLADAVVPLWAPMRRQRRLQSRRREHDGGAVASLRVI